MKLTFPDFIRRYNLQFKEAEAVYRSLARHCGLSETLMDILYTLRENNRPMTQAELVENLAVSKQTTHSALKHARELGILHMENIPEDKRSNMVSLTPQGEALAAETADRVLQMEERAFARLGEEDRAQLLAIQAKYLAALQESAAEELNRKVR